MWLRLRNRVCQYGWRAVRSFITPPPPSRNTQTVSPFWQKIRYLGNFSVSSSPRTGHVWMSRLRKQSWPNTDSSASLHQKKTRAASVTSVFSPMLKIIMSERKDEGNIGRNIFGGHIHAGIKAASYKSRLWYWFTFFTQYDSGTKTLLGI